MILKIVLLVLLFLISTILVILLEKVILPTVKKHTQNNENMLFARHQHIFTKLKPVEPIAEVTAKAFVLCNPDKSFNKKNNLKTMPGQSCTLINSIYNSLNDCKYSCIGLGDCKKACPQRAIVLKNDTAVVTDLCIGCGQCIEVCPKHIIKLIPLNATKETECANQEVELTTCNSYEKALNAKWTPKKGFKLWTSCYKLFYNKK